MVIVARLETPDAAGRLCRELQARGIEATAENAPEAVRGPSHIRGKGWAVEVQAEQFTEAMLVLRTLGLLDLSPWEAIPCPQCGSLKSEITKTYCHDMSLARLLLSLFVLGLPLLLRRPRLHCFDCGHLWPKPRR